MKIQFNTNFGMIEIEMHDDKTPKTCQNFVNLVRDGFYDGLIFHRVINQFMIQGGGFNADMEQKYASDTIENEADLGGSNKRGTVAMARTSDPHSASSQFFINVVDNPFLDHKNKSMEGWGYCVFGEVTQGLEVVDSIRKVATTRANGHQDVPVDAVVIESAVVVE